MFKEHVEIHAFFLFKLDIMNKRTKLKILKSTVASITIEYSESEYNRRGLCYHLDKACNEILGNYNPNIPSYSELTSFFGINKPKNTNYDSWYWFPLNEEGFNKRVTLLNKAIKKLSSPTKKKS